MTAKSIEEVRKLILPTFLENWPVELRALTVHQAGFPIEPADLGTNQTELYETWPMTRRSLQTIRASLNTYIPRVMAQAKCEGVFVRLGSRSPKDSYYEDGEKKWWQGPWPLQSTDEALGLLLCTSERINDDLHQAVAWDYSPWLWVREWVDLQPWQEFRCFVRDGQVTGISQYDYMKRQHYPQLQRDKTLYANAITLFLNKRVLPSLHIPNAVVDVYVTVEGMRSGRGRKASARLLEINPYFELTDPCLFTWDELAAKPEGEPPTMKINEE